MLNKSRIILRLQSIVFTLLFLSIIGVLAYMSKEYNKRIDVTLDQTNSLSITLQTMLEKLDKPLNITAYIPDDAVVETKLKQLMEQYRVFHDDINIEFVNPDLDPARAKADGILYSGQLLLKYGDEKETINSVDEQNVLNVLQRLSRTEKRLVIFIEGHGEASPLEVESNGISKLAEVLENKGFSLQSHKLLLTQSIPANASFVVIAAPKTEYLESEVELLTDYIKQGGNLLWLHEPGELYGLDNLEQQLGLVIQQGTLVDANQELQEMLGIKHPAAIAIIDYGPSELTNKLEAHTLFPFATVIEKDIEQNVDEDTAAWNHQSIMNTLGTSWLESGEMQGNVKFDDDADKPGPLNIGMVLTRDNLTEINQNTKVIPEQRVIVLGDSDFIRNSYIGQGSNVAFSSNMFNWLSDDDELLSIKSKVSSGATLSLSRSGEIGLLVLWLGIPFVLMSFGMWRWLRRRKR